MTRQEQEEGLRAWLLTRPESVQRLAAEFPVGIGVIIHGKVFYILGYTEEDALIISPINPGKHYHAARKKIQYLEAQHIRDGEVAIVPLTWEGK